MNRRRLIVLAAVLALISTTVSPAVAKNSGAERIPVAYESSGFVVFNFEQTESGQMLLGRVESGFGVSGHDFLLGTGAVTLEFQFNQKTGKGTGHGTIEFASANYADSGWVGTFDIHYSDILFAEVPPFGTLGVAWNSFNKQVLHGYGVFEGMKLRALDTVVKFVSGHMAQGEILVPPSATVPSP